MLPALHTLLHNLIRLLCAALLCATPLAAGPPVALSPVALPLVITEPAAEASAFTGVTPDLRATLEGRAAHELVRVNIILKDQLDLVSITRTAVAATDRRERRAVIWRAVTRHAAITQAPVIALLDAMAVAGDAGERRILHGANGINVWLVQAGITEVAAHPAVRSVDWDEDRPVEEVADALPRRQDETDRDITWNIDRVRAPELWAAGYTGAGVLIGVIDTGVNYNHHDLRDHLWDGGREFPNHGWNFVDDNNDPIDQGHSSGHGTRSAGICCGDGTAGTETGVAPDAAVMVLKAAGATGAESFIWLAQDFALAHGCDVITSSLSWKYHYNPDYVTWRQQEDLLLAADILHAQSAGNQQNDPCCPTPYNVSAPGLCPPPWLHPDQTLLGGLSGVTTVGNVDLDDLIHVTSSHGPSSWEEILEYGDYPWNPGLGLLRPDVAAPGAGTTSTAWNDDQGYAIFGGTSAAAPHVGGAYCLLRQAHPWANSSDLSRAIQLGAVDLGEAGKDNRYGAGRIDLVAAYEILAVQTIQSPTDLTAVDTPGDTGGSIDLAWVLSADDGGGNGLVENYAIYRTTTPGAYFPSPLVTRPTGTSFFQDVTTIDGVEYYYQVVATGPGPESEPSNEAGPAVSQNNSPAAVGDGARVGRPADRLLDNAANPFSVSTRVRYELATAGEVELVIHDVSGTHVRTLIDGWIGAGRHQLDWDGRDASGRVVATGIYWLRLSGPDFTSTRKILKLR